MGVGVENLAARCAEAHPSHARERTLARAPPIDHMPAMAGSPLKRARKQGVRLDDGSVIAYPRMPRVAELPKGWRHFSPAQKIEHLIGLDRCHEILSWSPAGLDPAAVSARIRSG